MAITLTLSHAASATGMSEACSPSNPPSTTPEYRLRFRNGSATAPDRETASGIPAVPISIKGRLKRSPSGHRVRLDLLFGVIAAPHQRAGFDVAQAARFALGLPGGELVGVDPADDRQVLRRRL